ncbi:MAG TPA: AtpZ/AtpI family protein [Mucilaginibacter sp.]|jgi:hypothetical protein
MDENEKNDKPQNGSPGNNYLKFSGVGFQMIAIIGAFSYAGYKIDQSANHQTKWVTAVLALTGVFISLYVVIKSLKE